jgi:2-polyprenyl-3-methyl-5-hydroxy-6-metoxy-1,4-benzoquinol methylase
MNDEILENIARSYRVDEDYDYFNTKLAAMIICSYCKGKTALEVGSADGVMTGELLKVCAGLTVAEPSAGYCAIIRKKFGSSITIYNSYLSEIKDHLAFDGVVLAGLLHHVKDPDVFLETVKGFLAEDGIVLATVPSMTSLHRRIGVKAGLLEDVYGTTERNRRFHQFGRFDKASFEKLFGECGYEILESYGYMLKPFSSEQMMSLKLDWKVIHALYEIGRENEHLASQLFIRARLRR